MINNSCKLDPNLYLVFIRLISYLKINLEHWSYLKFFSHDSCSKMVNIEGEGEKKGRKEGKKGLGEDLEKYPGIVITSLFLMIVFRVFLMFIENIMDRFSLY